MQVLLHHSLHYAWRTKCIEVYSGLMGGGVRWGATPPDPPGGAERANAGRFAKYLEHRLGETEWAIAALAFERGGSEPQE